MKHIFPSLLCIILALSACVPKPAEREEDISPMPEVATTLPNNNPPAAAKVNQPPMGNIIKFADDGKTFTFQVGEMLNVELGSSVFTWEVSIGDPAIVALELEASDASQGSVIALAPGTTTLTAVGSPICLKSVPPCKMPTVLFRVTLIVE